MILVITSLFRMRSLQPLDAEVGVFQRDQRMTDADAALLYSRVGRVYFDGTGDALNFINTIESRTRTGYSDYQRILVVEISVSAAAQDWFMQCIQPYMTTMTWTDFRERFMRFFCPASVREEQRWKLLNLVRGDRSMEEYTREFFILSRYATDVL